ncbi:MAG: SDR family NAD(P)-dependent oxidoreductase [bacterium]|nr:SDR family NAD(P)-dependent oxidoreductase [bacterium]MDE0287029.1 SDR family NAD(P)-dependent oxidoreductase [bacterium]MDE0440471.1 SDR family NAD(P)-dependent oxidoreductase [bacterium]
MTAEPGTTIVSGGSSGIGRAVVEGLQGRGRSVAILDIHPPPDDLLANGQVLFLECDTTDPAAVHEAVAHVANQVGRIDGLATCAGIGGASARQGIGSSQWDRVKAIVNVNLLGSYWLLESCAVAMAGGGGGSIVLVGSVLSRKGMAGMSAYSAAKGGIEGLTRSAAVELADRGIRVNCVLPGPILTPMSRTGFEADGLSVEQWIERMARSVPLSRVGMPEDVAAVVLFLLDEASGYMTGASLMVDGGANVG